jgi:hypothetical protein
MDLAKPRPDDLGTALKGLSSGLAARTDVLGVAKVPEIPSKATTGIEPV